MEGFIIIISIVWGVLCIFLFFKIWGMTNDVAKLTQIVEKIASSKDYNGSQCESSKKECSATQNSDNSTGPAPEKEPICHNFKVGDEVIHTKFGTKMKIVGIKGNHITCDRGFFTGLATYNASELKPVKGIS